MACGSAVKLERQPRKRELDLMQPWSAARACGLSETLPAEAMLDVMEREDTKVIT